MRKSNLALVWVTPALVSAFLGSALLLPDLPCHGEAMPTTGVALDHVRGTVVRVTSTGYQVRTDDHHLVKVMVPAGAHLYQLVPETRLVVRNGWYAHAIGPANQGRIRARMLVIFPPDAFAGVPPPGNGITGVGRIEIPIGEMPAGTGRTRRSRTDRGLLIRVPAAGIRLTGLLIRVPARESVQLDPTTTLVVARPAPLNVVHPGEMAMAFGWKTLFGFTATIVHLPPHLAMMPGPRMQASGAMKLGAGRTEGMGRGRFRMLRSREGRNAHQ